jgi:hypothetical protein
MWKIEALVAVRRGEQSSRCQALSKTAASLHVGMVACLRLVDCKTRGRFANEEWAFVNNCKILCMGMDVTVELMGMDHAWFGAAGDRDVLARTPRIGKGAMGGARPRGQAQRLVRQQHLKAVRLEGSKATEST